jgi:hypothetical protein
MQPIFVAGLSSSWASAMAKSLPVCMRTRGGKPTLRGKWHPGAKLYRAGLAFHARGNQAASVLFPRTRWTMVESHRSVSPEGGLTNAQYSLSDPMPAPAPNGLADRSKPSSVGPRPGRRSEYRSHTHGGIQPDHLRSKPYRSRAGHATRPVGLVCADQGRRRE